MKDKGAESCSPPWARLTGETLRRFFVRPEDVDGDQITITGGDAGHISRVLRLGPGDKLSISDGVSRVYDAEITAVEQGAVVCMVSHSREFGDKGYELTLFQGLPKGRKMELIVEKLTEVGVDRIVPIAMARSVAEYTGERGDKKLTRWRATALEAAKQSRRVTVPVVEAIASWPAVMDGLKRVAAEGGVVLIPWEGAGDVTVRQALASKVKGRGDERWLAVVIMIGPEGGFADTEIVDLHEAGGTIVTLGQNILRTETAGIVAAALAIDALRGT